MRFFEFNSEITLKFEGAYILNEEIIRTENITFRTLSPILLEYDVDGKKEPLLPLNNSEFTEFNKHFTAVHHRILRDIRTENNKKGPGLYKELEFFPLKIRKKVVKHTLHGFRELTGKPYMMLTCFEGCFDLKGDPRDLQMFYQIGIGLRTGQGFGMVEVVG
ncbi:MAG: hypothetical protein DDT42_01212 [candidate division WS2 bacterium]|uniref:CRISPR associated protein Cas6 C-terminal domain-containing protein n=1 Tax=Psychracetigena formicireducens TaxID=2986056 RepID=A0A9E2BIR2_PSYF1|nr:hypothetical protein [Candidatus Psychracetigena formicireducens]